MEIFVELILVNKHKATNGIKKTKEKMKIIKRKQEAVNRRRTVKQKIQIGKQ